MTVTLTDVRPNERIELVGIPDGDTRARLLRLGFCDGTVVCRHQIRGGPTVLERNHTELAVGASLAERIEVDRSPADSER